MKIKYVGLKEDGEAAFSDETQITWLPGSVQDVPLAIAQRMLKHPDVFAVDNEPLMDKQIGNDWKIPLSDGTLVPLQLIMLPDGVMHALDDKDKAELHAMAKAHGVDVHHNAGADKVITALVAAFPVMPTE